MAERDPYELLGVEPEASDEEARAAWRRLVSIYHPDQHAHKAEDVRAEAERRMAGVNEAYQYIVRGDGRVPRRESPPSTPPAPASAPNPSRARDLPR